MKRFLLIGLITALALSVAAPSMASNGRAAPAKAHVAKKCKKKHGKRKCKKKQVVIRRPVPTPPPTPPPTPKPLTDAEVIDQVVAKAAVYCAPDPDCIDYGYYFDGAPGVAACTSKSTYTWACLGWMTRTPTRTPSPTSPAISRRSWSGSESMG